MNSLWHKVWADLFQSKSRSLLAIVSIAAGVFCVGTLFGMIDLLLTQMDAAHSQSRPSHISLMLGDDVDRSVLERMDRIPGVAGIDTMTPLNIRYRTHEGQDWQTATLIIRSDFEQQQYDMTTLVNGRWPAPGRIAIENLSAKATGLAMGDEIELETRSGIQRLAIDGVVRHPFVKPPKFGGQSHFFADSTTAANLFGLNPAHARQLMVQLEPPYSNEQANRLAAELRTQLAKLNLRVHVSLLQDPDQHWGRPFLAGINRVLQWMAWAALALASVLIFNTVSAHITRQTDQIGVIKALGGSTFRIAIIYLSEVLIMAVAAIFVAVVPAVYAADAASRRLLALFNIEGNPFEVSHTALLYMLQGGLCVPLLAALLPILRGSAMTVRAAIASYGLGADFGSSRFDIGLEKRLGRWLPTLYAAALGNLFRRKGRLWLTQSVLIIASVMFLVLASLIASLNLTLDNELARSRYAVKIGFSEDQSIADMNAMAQSVAGVGQIEFWQRFPIEVKTADDHNLRQKGSLGLQMLALPKNGEMYRPLIERGQWLQADDADVPKLVISADTAALNGLQVGDSVKVLLGADWQSWQIGGIYRWLAGHQYAVEPVYAALETISASTRRQDRAAFAVMSAVIDTADEEAALMRRLKQQFQDHHILLDAYTTIARLDQGRFSRNQFRPVLGTLMGLAVMIAAVGGIGLSGTLGIGVLQRTREIGVLRAIGAPSSAVRRLLVLEGLLHGLMAWLISLPLGYLSAEPMAKELGLLMFGIQLDYRFNSVAAGYWLVMLMLIAWMASSLPAHKAARLTIKESFGV